MNTRSRRLVLVSSSLLLLALLALLAARQFAPSGSQSPITGPQGLQSGAFSPPNHLVPQEQSAAAAAPTPATNRFTFQFDQSSNAEVSGPAGPPASVPK